MIRVLLADDQPIVRAGVGRILSPEDGFSVVAQCEDGTEVADTLASTVVDVVLMDVRMPRMDGIEATRLLREDAGAPPVLVLTTFAEDEVLWSAIAAGAGASSSRTPRHRTSSPRPGRWPAVGPGSTPR